jgi:TPR repeat protein
MAAPRQDLAALQAELESIGPIDEEKLLRYRTAQARAALLASGPGGGDRATTAHAALANCLLREAARAEAEELGAAGGDQCDDTTHSPSLWREAAEHLAFAAGCGDAEALFSLGVCLERRRFSAGDASLSALVEDRDVRKGEEPFVELYRRAARSPPADPRASCASTRAAFNLGVCLSTGLGVAQLDESEALSWFRVAADRGHTLAAYNLALTLHRGSGGTVDGPGAVQWFESAAGAGHVGAMSMLGVIFQGGAAGVAADPTAAMEWFQRAAEAGDVSAQVVLASCLLEGGDGVERDVERAREWFARAAGTFFVTQGGIWSRHVLTFFFVPSRDTSPRGRGRDRGPGRLPRTCGVTRRRAGPGLMRRLSWLVSRALSRGRLRLRPV